MSMKEVKSPSQEQRILEVLEKHSNEWVSGQHFVRTMMITQYHARIFSLQKKGYKIYPSDFTDEWGFKSYKLVPKDTLF